MAFRCPKCNLLHFESMQRSVSLPHAIDKCSVLRSHASKRKCLTMLLLLVYGPTCSPYVGTISVSKLQNILERRVPVLTVLRFALNTRFFRLRFVVATPMFQHLSPSFHTVLFPAQVSFSRGLRESQRTLSTGTFAVSYSSRGFVHVLHSELWWRRYLKLLKSQASGWVTTAIKNNLQT